MKWWKSVLGVVAVFLLGAVTGAMAIQHFHSRIAEDVLSGKGDAAAELAVRRLTRSLDLDPAQEARARAIIRQTHREIVEIRKPIMAEIESAVERSRERVRAILRPDQQREFDRLQTDRRERIKSGDGPGS